MEENHKRDTSNQIPQPIRPQDGTGGTDPGPRDVWRDIQNPDMLVPPVTDNGTTPNLRFSFSDTHMKLAHGGWSRQITTNDLPIATALAGVDMRLNPGAVRELHWHSAAEWAFMTYGTARLTCVDTAGRNFITDVGVGDIWFFPPGYPHSIQGLQNGCEFLLVFDQGNFSEDDTFTVSDMFAHIPKDVLSANFGIPQSVFAPLPTSQKFIFPASVPGPLAADHVSGPQGTVPQSFVYRTLKQPSTRFPGGQVRIVDSSNFPVTTISLAFVELEAGAMRELHWHTVDEWDYYLQGSGRLTAFAAEATANTFDVRSGDVGYVPRDWGHYIQNTGNTKLSFLEVFNAPRYEDISVATWLALIPPELVEANLNLGSEFIESLRKRETPIVNFPSR